MRFKSFFIPLLFASACMTLPIPGLSGGGKAQKTETSSSTTSSEMHVNGRPVSVAARDDEDEDDDRRPAKKKKRSEGDFGKTCHKNNECEADACFVGAGDLGYCTKF